MRVFFIKFAFLNTSAIMYDVYMSGENFYKDIYILLMRKLNSWTSLLVWNTYNWYSGTHKTL